MTDKDLKQIRTAVRKEVSDIVEFQLEPVNKKLNLIDEKADGILKFADEIEKATNQLNSYSCS
jgi:septation ring formation regulator EzrA